MRLQKYPVWLLGSFLLSVMMAVAGFYLALGNRIEAGRGVAECLEQKTLAVKNRSPRLIILSGSNAHFGFSARRLSEKYGVESVNASAHAGLGIDYILDYGSRFFAAGRLFVLPLEYELYGKPGAGPPYQHQVMGFDAAYFHSMAPGRKLDFFAQISLDDRVTFLRNVIHPYTRNDIGGYQARTLNAWGDETNNSVLERTSEHLRAATRRLPAKYYIDEAAWSALAAFVQRATASGSRVVLAYPNIYAKSLDMDLNRDFFATLIAKASRLGVPIIGRPEDSRFNADVAFDTYYHQTSDGQARSTDRLMSALKESGEFKAGASL